MARRAKSSPAIAAGAFVGGPVLARALRQFYYRGRTIMANDLVRGATVIEQLESAGHVDSSPAQVDYCVTQGVNPIDLEEPGA